MVDAVDLIYTQYKSTITQEVISQRLLPAGFEAAEIDEKQPDAEVEPSVEALLRSTTCDSSKPRFTRPC